jgi:hypothetical protein
MSVGSVRALIVVIAVLAIAGLTPILFVRHLNKGKYRRRTEEVLTFIEANDYEFIGSTTNDLGKLKKMASSYHATVSNISGKRADTLLQDMRVYRLVAGYVEETNLPFGNKTWVHNLFAIPRKDGIQHLFDYVYRYVSRGEGTSRTTEYRHTVAAFTSDKLTLPWFGLVPAAQVIRGEGSAGIVFDTHPVFARKYRVFGEDEEAIRRLFGPEVLTLFENHGGLRVHGNRNRFIVFRAEPTYVSPEELDSYINTANAVYTAFVNQR